MAWLARRSTPEKATTAQQASFMEVEFRRILNYHVHTVQSMKRKL
jgi:hypothetical protein